MGRPGKWRLLLATLAAHMVAWPHAEAAEDAIVPQQAISLFNGRRLVGFHTWLVDTGRADPRRVFAVTNGMIHISGEGFYRRLELHPLERR